MNNLKHLKYQIKRNQYPFTMDTCEIPKDGIVLFSNNELDIVLVKISPSTARALLNAYQFTGQRSKRNIHVKKIEAAITANEFYSFSVIECAVAPKGTGNKTYLIDGQHRLEAIANLEDRDSSDSSDDKEVLIPMMIRYRKCRDEKEVKQLYAIHDALSLTRSRKDQLIALGYDKKLTSASRVQCFQAAANLLLMNFNLNKRLRTHSIGEVDEKVSPLVNVALDYFAILDHHNPSHRTQMERRTVMGPSLLLLVYSQEKAVNFLNQLADKEFTATSNHPVMTLRNFFNHSITGGMGKNSQLKVRYGYHEALTYFVRCWNAFLLGKDMKLPINVSLDQVAILGTPFSLNHPNTNEWRVFFNNIAPTYKRIYK